MTNCSFRNNIGFGLVRSYPTIYTPAIYNAGSLKIDHNLWYNPAGWRLDEYSTKGDSFIEANPLFVNATGYNFHLQPTSPAIGTGYGGVNIGSEDVFVLPSIQYVALTGSDTSGDGTINHPWRSINKGLSSIVAGDTLYIRGGTYYERLQIGNLVGNSALWTVISNYQGEPVIIDGAGLYAPAQIYSSSYVQFNGVELKNSQNRWGIGLSLECHYITLSNLLIHDTYAGAVYAAYDDVGYHPNMITHIVLDNVHTLNTNKGLTGEAISLVTVDNFEIKNSLIEHTFKSGDTQQAGIDTKYGCTNGHIHHNELNDCGAGFYCGNINQGVTSNIEFDYNIVHHCMALGGTGMLLDSEGVPISMTGVNAHDNTFYYNYRGISVFWEAGVGTSVKTFSFTNNILAYNGDAGLTEIWLNDTTGYLNCVVSGNTIIGKNANTLMLCNKAVSGVSNTGNKFYNAAGYYPQGVDNQDYGTNASIGLAAVLDNIKGILQSGVLKTARVPLIDMPTGQMAIELWLGPDENTKIATSGKLSFISVGTQTVNVPITMPGRGVYNVYMDIYIGNLLFASFINDQVVIVA